MPADDALGAVTLVVTAQCNLRCRYCYQDRKHAQSMAWPVLRAAVGLAGRARSRRVSVAFLGGEPLLEMRLVRRAVRYAYRLRAPARWRFSLTTNGLLLTPPILSFLIANKFGLQVSFDGVAAAQDQRAAGSFTRLDRLLGRLSRRHPGYYRHHVSVALTVAPATISHLADSVGYLLSKDVRRIDVAPAMGQSGWHPRRFEELEHQMREAASAARRHAARTGRLPIALMRRPADWHAPPPYPGTLCCSVAAGNSIVVDVDGRLYPCATLAQSYQDLRALPMGERLEAMQVGHVLDPRLQDRAETLRERALDAGIFCRRTEKRAGGRRCRECALAGACRVCPVDSAHDPGVTQPSQVSGFLCAFTRASLTHLVR